MKRTRVRRVRKRVLARQEAKRKERERSRKARMKRDIYGAREPTHKTDGEGGLIDLATGEVVAAQAAAIVSAAKAAQRESGKGEEK